ncbi:KxYKxGKxW signal peptide domain-containing protein [Lacticaseibacillus kribbianus]|nr:KxYKxGKxW signal peptide domain-containing protein [Lacticaseibacillus kribbianus]
MKDRRGDKKLYKSRKGWVVAGVAAATLFTAGLTAQNTVGAATDQDQVST